MAEEKTKSVVKVVNLKKSYTLGKISVPALRGLNYDFQPGFTVVAGASGSGKSTLLNIIGCLDDASEGKVYLNGRLMNDLKEKEKSMLRRSTVGFIFQSFSLIPVLSVFDNVEYPLLRSSLDKVQRRERVCALLEDVGLGNYIKRFPSELSGGQMQRVAIARALVAHPQLIIADEPTANLDSVTGDKILGLMERIHRERGASIIIASHDGNVLEKITNVLYLKDGRIDDSVN